MQPIILTIPIAISAAVTIRADYQNSRRVVYVFKPLTTLLILLLALLAPAPIDPLYQGLIVAGLIFSLAGDVFLMLPGNTFVPGLLSFLVAHLCYIGAFVSGAGLRVTLWLVPCAAFFVIFMRLLWPHTGALRVPVVAYGTVISVMMWQAVERAAVGAAVGAVAGAAVGAAVGAVLFVLSDSALAWNRFVKPLRAAQALVLGTYWAGQLLIALSVSV